MRVKPFIYIMELTNVKTNTAIIKYMKSGTHIAQNALEKKCFIKQNININTQETLNFN